MRNYLFIAAVAGSAILLTACQTTPHSTSSVSHVFNFAPQPTQANLEQQVQEALIRSGDPVIGQVRVQSIQNTVILSGYVKKIRQSDTAEQLAHKVPGVQIVENRIIVRP